MRDTVRLFFNFLFSGTVNFVAPLPPEYKPNSSSQRLRAELLWFEREKLIIWGECNVFTLRGSSNAKDFLSSLFCTEFCVWSCPPEFRHLLWSLSLPLPSEKLNEPLNWLRSPLSIISRHIYSKYTATFNSFSVEYYIRECLLRINKEMMGKFICKIWHKSDQSFCWHVTLGRSIFHDRDLWIISRFWISINRFSLGTHWLILHGFVSDSKENAEMPVIQKNNDICRGDLGSIVVSHSCTFWPSWKHMAPENRRCFSAEFPGTFRSSGHF